MARKYALIVVTALACGASTPAPTTPAPRTAVDWTRACAARLESARKASGVRGGEVKTDTSAWHPGVRFEVKIGGGYMHALVSHGQGACIDFDTDVVNVAWRDSSDAKSVALDRLRRMNGDEATVQAERVPAKLVAPFRAAFEPALDGCLIDAQSVPLGKVPPEISCTDKRDVCPNDPETTDFNDVDGCPDTP
jgi:hypothetical protein